MPWTRVMARRLLILACFTVIKGTRPGMADMLSFTSEPNSRVYVQNNESFLVPCEVAGEPPVIKYWRNESVLNSRVVINITTEGLWFVNGVQSLGSSGVHRVGIFRCIARNTAGVVMSKKFELSFIRLRNISVQLSSAALFHNVARLKCIVDVNQTVKYTWFKDHTPLDASKDSRLEVLPYGVLRIKDYRASDDGIYSCRAENEYKVVTSRGLKVVGKPALNTSIHIYPGKDIHTVVGSPLVIECIQYSPKKSSVVWSKVTGLDTRTLVNGTGFVNLAFDSVQESDAGEYRCAAEGIEKVVRLSVGVAPSFTTKLSLTTERVEGESLMLKCHVSGNPTPKITWYKNGQALVQDSRLHLHRNNVERSLVLHNLEMSDRGVYQCEIENKHGSSIDDTLVDVAEKIDISYEVQGYAVSPTEINVSWKIPQMGYKSVYFVVNCLDYLRDSDFQYITSYNATSLILTKLRPYTKYAIYVKMYTEISAVRGHSNAFWITTKGKIPSGNPNEITLTSYSYRTLDVTWIPPLVLDRNGEIISYEIKYSIAGDSKEFNLTISKPLYTTTLSKLIEGKNYTVKIAARTKEGLGPFSKDVFCVVSRTSVATVIPPPLVNVKNINASIMVSVTPPTHPDVKGYHLTYRHLGDSLGAKTTVVVNGKAFDYQFEKKEINSEYVINVTAFGPGSRGRPKLVVVSTSDFPVILNYTMFRKFSNHTNYLLPIIICHPALNYTAIVVKWRNIPLGNDPEFKVKYFMQGATKETNVVTKYSNLTIYDVAPGKPYFVQVQTIFRQYPVLRYSTEGIPQSRLCKIPAKRTESHANGVTCTVLGSAIVVKWRASPNIVMYNVIWQSTKNQMETVEIRKGAPLTWNITDFQRLQNLTVFVSTGKSLGHCIIDSRNIPFPPKPNDEPDDENVDDNDDIEKGIIIGCIISVLLLFLLVMFVCWSGCRRRKPKRDGQNNGTLYYTRGRSQRPDTVSTEVSEISTKHNNILKKFVDEETSKESDRGVGMTPKSSRLYLDSEKMPFLPQAVNQSGSVDTSYDSQDSGVQGLGKKVSPTPGALKDRDKTPLQPKESAVETVF